MINEDQRLSLLEHHNDTQWRIVHERVLELFQEDEDWFTGIIPRDEEEEDYGAIVEVELERLNLDALKNIINKFKHTHLITEEL